MTIEKAIEQLEDLIKEAENHMTGNKIDDEIPKKVKREFATMGGCITCFETDVCPACGKDFYIEDLGQTMYCSFCPDCGQALDWSDENV